MEGSQIHCPDEWSLLVQEIVSSPGVVFILGAPDTGKSTLAFFLCAQAMQAGLRTAYLDGDLGQSVISPPTTVGMVLFAAPPCALEHLGWDLLYFIGATSPADHLLATAAGVGRLTRKAIEQGAHVVVVDTSGLVAGSRGFELKFAKMELLNPRHVIAIQQANEVEHILKGVRGRRGIMVHLLSPSPEVRIRPPEARRAYRQMRFEAYFHDSSLRTLSLDAVQLIHPEQPLLASEGPVERMDEQWKGIVVGLNDEEYLAKGLGIWEGFDRQRNEVSIRTPLEDLSAIRYLHLGHITLTITP
jgi:polynucleotide 5'-hydroxyl-kinase GRC3/NOL9